MRYLQIILLFVCVLSLSACTPDSDSKEARNSLFKSVDLDPVHLTHTDDQAPLEKIKKDVAQINELYDVAIVQKDKQILVAYKVRHMKRFQMKKIEKDLKAKLKQDFPNYEFLVSSDMKIFLEATELIVHVTKENYPEKKAQKWFEKIVNLEKEMT